MATVAVLDYGSGNVHSAAKALTAAGAQVELTRDPVKVAKAHGLLVPGVGAFAAVMQQLRAVGGDDMILARAEQERPLLGICVGQQVMFERGTEHGEQTTGLGIFPGTVERLASPQLPHMGWNTVSVQTAQPATAAAHTREQRTALFSGVENERFYFVHSYAVQPCSELIAAADTVVTVSEHDGAEFVAAVERGSVSATQFHPEKSAAAGLSLLRNWVRSLSTPL